MKFKRGKRVRAVKRVGEKRVRERQRQRKIGRERESGTELK